MAFKAKRNHTVAQKEIENGKALVEAAMTGDLEEVQQLLNDGTSVDADDYNRSLFYKSLNYMTPLLCAASKGHTRVLKLLIDTGGKFVFFPTYFICMINDYRNAEKTKSFLRHE